MALRSIFRRNAPAATGPHRSAEVDTSADRVDPLEQEWQPIVVGTTHPPRERAILLVEAMIAAGYESKAVYQADLAVFHRILCEKRGWAHVSWVAICREMKRFGLRKYYMHVDGERLTMYEMQPVTDSAATVVEVAAVEKRRA